MRPEDRAAALVVRGAPGALSGATGALLAVGLGATADHLTARLRVVRPDPSGRELCGDGLVQDGLVDGRGEKRFAQLHAADRGSGSIVDGRLRHQTFLTRMSEPRAPGSDPLTSSRLRSGSVRTTRTFLTVACSSPIWPAMRTP